LPFTLLSISSTPGNAIQRLGYPLGCATIHGDSLVIRPNELLAHRGSVGQLGGHGDHHRAATTTALTSSRIVRGNHQRSFGCPQQLPESALRTWEFLLGSTPSVGSSRINTLDSKCRIAARPTRRFEALDRVSMLCPITPSSSSCWAAHSPALCFFCTACSPRTSAINSGTA